MKNKIQIYCKKEDNIFCQKLLFNRGYFWWYNGKKLLKKLGYAHEYIIFHLDIDMSFAVSNNIIGHEIYYKDFFKREFRELKLKIICKD